MSLICLSMKSYRNHWLFFLAAGGQSQIMNADASANEKHTWRGATSGGQSAARFFFTQIVLPGLLTDDFALLHLP